MHKRAFTELGAVERCFWANGKALDYHDNDWGILYDDPIRTFELFILATFAAGLPWSMVISRQEGFRTAFANSDPEVVATFGDAEVVHLLNDASILRNKNKILATINNARCYLSLAADSGLSVHQWLLQYVGGQPVVLDIPERMMLPEKSDVSAALALDFKKRGFKLLGAVACQNILYAGGYINGHWNGCAYKQVHVPA